MIDLCTKQTNLAQFYQYSYTAVVCILLPGVTGCRSDAVTIYESGLIPDHWIILADIFRNQMPYCQILSHANGLENASIQL